MALYRLFLGTTSGDAYVGALGPAQLVITAGSVNVTAIAAGDWAVVGSSFITTFTGTTWTPLEPSGVTAGDLLVACIATRFGSATFTITPPSGWAMVSQAATNDHTTGTSGIGSVYMAYIVRGASTPAMTFSFAVGANVVSIGQVWAYRGARPSTPLDVSASSTTATATTAISVTGLTTTLANDLIVAAIGGGQAAIYENFNATDPSGASGVDDSTSPPSSTWGRRLGFSTTTADDTALAIFDAIKTTVGATGNFTATASLGAGHAVVSGAFRIGVAVNTSASATSQIIISSVGSVTATAAIGASTTALGQACAISVGDVTVTTVQNTSTITIGNLLTSAVGNANAVTTVSPVVTTNLMTSAVGTVTVAAAQNISATATTNLLTSAVDAVTVTAIQHASVSVTTNLMTSGVGGVSVTAGGSASTSVAGYLLTADIGTVEAAVSTSHSVTGQGLAVSCGTALANGTANADVNGLLINASTQPIVVRFASALPVAGLLIEVEAGRIHSTNWGTLTSPEETWTVVPYD